MNYNNLLVEPPDHAIGRSGGGMTTKFYALEDGSIRPLEMMLGPGQGGDSPMLENLMDALKVGKAGTGAATRRPEQAMADNPYSSRAIRRYLRGQGIQ